MKKMWMVLLLFFCCSLLKAQGIDPVSILIAKAVKAIDLKVQKMQNETLWLQHAQQMAENELSSVKLGEIQAWAEKQRELYAGYFQELTHVKKVIKDLPQVRQILQMHVQVSQEYHRFTKDPLQQPAFDELILRSKDIVASIQQLMADNRFVMKDFDRALFLCGLREAMGDCLDRIRVLNQKQAILTASKNRISSDNQFLKNLHLQP